MDEIRIMMAKVKTLYQCQECGYETAKYLGRCPECLTWNCFLEKITAKAQSPYQIELPAAGSKQFAHFTPPETPEAIMSQDLASMPMVEHTQVVSTGFTEIDRVLGGGLFTGAFLLLGGDPGVGKSTVMLQVAEQLGRQNKRVLYVSGEESLPQLKQRADRLGVNSANIHVLSQTQWELVLRETQSLCPDVLIVDSIQSIYHSEFSGPPGSVGQVRDCSGLLMQLAKGANITVIVIGHVTKEGMVAGPKLLEHMVDGVFYLQGDDHSGLRLLSSVKNRFGPTSELGVFEMRQEGMQAIDNPSEWFLASRSSHIALPGSAVMATMQGNRCVLVEIQALVAPSAYTSPVRIANGFDKNRLHQIVAILERRVGLALNRFDIYVNVVGGMRLQDPAADLAVALAVVSSARDLPLPALMCVCGELGLTGEIRPVRQLEQRLKEASQLGFTQVLAPLTSETPKSGKKEAVSNAVVSVETLTEALHLALPLNQTASPVVQ